MAATYKVVEGIGEAAIIERTMQRSENIRVAEMLAKIADFKVNIKAKVEEHNRQIDKLTEFTAGAGDKARIDIPAKLKVT
jgi:hypothetical protein|tara:strand:- start:1337 stop:1576 length:240 start_codon:yes stop_codon:yes gene_type:complete